jgi:hypothetical protein
MSFTVQSFCQWFTIAFTFLGSTIMDPSPLANPLATVAQLEDSGSRLDGVPADLENSIRYAGAKLTQAAGILLRLPQEVIAQAIVVFMRFWVGPEGGSLAELGAKVSF